MARNTPIADRISELAKALGLSERKVAEEAGLSPAYVAALRKRELSGSDKGADARALVRIASVLNTTVEYLVTGEGPRWPADVDPRDPYPSRQRAILAARSMQRPESAIVAVRAMDPGSDMGTGYWWAVIEAETHRVASLEEQPSRSGKGERNLGR